ncbi:50S ribosome-binding GTPase [Vibrio tritonius]|uniref:50S ribosome-binding GTPase n=1 Tax=Vibrio tritonius TaxID=1435069 RepID=A0ABS7YU78_9VIBR|nr:GTPase [Vibrio tritonius]MCA2017769.1 50S ribosome-binding GTPase [Vibrio tritonius]
MRNPFVEIAQNLNESKRVVATNHPNHQVDSVYAELKEKLDDNTLQVMLYGAYNAGKSTLINALIGQEKATVNDIPTTDTVDYYDWNGYRLLDTPGVNAPIDHEQTTIEQIKRTQVMLFVIREGDQDSKDLYQRLFEMIKLNKKIFIVLNHQLTNDSDKVTAYQKIIQILCHKASEYGVSNESIQQIKVLSMNVKTALTGRLKDNHPQLLERSGYSEFIEVFDDWLKSTDNQDNQLSGIKSAVDELWYKPVINQMTSGDNTVRDELLTNLRNNKNMLVNRQRSLVVEARNMISHELMLIKSDISNCVQSTSDQAQLDSQLQRMIDPIGDKLETWVSQRLGEVNALLNIEVSARLQQSLGSNNTAYIDKAVKGLGNMATPDNIKKVLVQGRAFKIPGLKGRWEKTLGKWAGKGAIAVQVATALWDVYSEGKKQDEQNVQERQAAVSLYQIVDDICLAAKRDYGNVAEQVITEILDAQICALDNEITEVIAKENQTQQAFQQVLDYQSQLNLIGY